MAEPARKLPTFDDLYMQVENLPQGVTGEILEPGVLRTKSRPGRRHGRAAKQILRGLGCFDVEGGGTGWWILIEPEIRLPGPRLAVPDLVGYRIERVPDLPEDNPLPIVPDWCCEVLSPSTVRDDRIIKLPLYASSGVGWIWIVEPALRTVEVFETVSGRASLMLTARDDQTIVLPPFNGPIELASWWLPPPIPGAVPVAAPP
jgi:Uma2 family endonuclease